MAGRSILAPLILCFAIPSALAQTGSVIGTAAQPQWHELSAGQRTALAPLSEDWDLLSDNRRLKWLGIAKRYAQMAAFEQARLQDRMREWASLSPTERQLARDQYLRLRAASDEQRQEIEHQWEAYQALPTEERERLRARPAPTQSTPAGRKPAKLGIVPQSTPAAASAPALTAQSAAQSTPR